MSVKDVVTSLVDDGLVDSEKIGTSIYFWAFPSKASQARRAKLEKVTEERDKIRERLATMKKEAEVVANLEKALEEKQKLEARLKDFADNDPAVMEQMVKETRDALEATNRWTD